MQSAITWFEIPALDFSRAVQFYETLLDIKLKQEDMPGSKMGVFPYSDPGVGGCVTKAQGYVPSADGTVVYIPAVKSLDQVLDRVSRAGGKIAVPKTLLSQEVGHFAHIIDSEGNRVGLHQPPL